MNEIKLGDIVFCDDCGVDVEVIESLMGELSTICCEQNASTCRFVKSSDDVGLDEPRTDDYGFSTVGNFIEKHDVEDAVNLTESWSFNLSRGKLHFDRADMMLHNTPSASADCIITDPPYWTLDRWREVGTTTRLGGALKAENRDESRWFKTIDKDELTELIDECSRVLKKDGHCWMMCDGQTLPYVLGYATHGDCHEFEYVKPYPVIKRASTGGYRQGMGYHGRCCHEYVVFLGKKKHRKFNDRNWPDVFDVVWSGDAETRPFTSDGKPYPTAKPVSLFRRWVELSTQPDEIILDPFMGSGTTIVAALETGRRFIGMDVSPEAIRTTARRIENFYRSEAQSGFLFDDLKSEAQ